MKVEEMRPQQMTTPEIRAGAQSAKGLREENQDAMTRFHSRFGEVILVADGMGGHLGGAVASDMVAQRFRYHLDAAAESTMQVADALQVAATRVNDEIHERGHSGDPSVAGMGSTLVVAVLRRSAAGQEVIVANAGDSRAYLLRDGILRQLTRDHTAAQRMVEAGMISAAEARHHPQGSVLSRALGQQIGTTVEVYPPVTLQSGDGLLLCSDGLSGYAMDADITQAIGTSSDPNAVVRNLVDLALNKGSDDNITVQFLRLGSAPVELPMPQAAAVLPAPPRRPRRLFAIAAVLAVLVAGATGWMSYRYLIARTNPAKPGADKKGDQKKKDLKNTLPLSKDKDQKKTGEAPQGIENPMPQPAPQQGAPQQPQPGTSPPPQQGAQPQPHQADSGQDGAPVDSQRPVKKRNVLFYPGIDDVEWLPVLQNHSMLQISAAQPSGHFRPDREEILVWYRKDAKADFERLASRIPVLRRAKGSQEESLPSKVDILIVMPR